MNIEQMTAEHTAATMEQIKDATRCLESLEVMVENAVRNAITEERRRCASLCRRERAHWLAMASGDKAVWTAMAAGAAHCADMIVNGYGPDKAAA